MKKFLASLAAVAALVVVSCNPIDPAVEPSDGVNLTTDNTQFEDKKASLDVVLGKAKTEDVTVKLAYGSASTFPEENLTFEREIKIPAGKTSVSVELSLSKKNVADGEYKIVISIAEAVNEEIGAHSSVTFKALIEHKAAFETYPGYKKVKTFPTLIITTVGGEMPQRRNKEFNYVDGHVVFNDPEGMYSDVPVVEMDMQIRGRGNTTWNNAKKGYKIKLDENSKIFGMKGDRDWAIIAEWSDGTLLRNQTAMQVSRIVGMPWTPECRSVEVTFNGTKLGLYTLFEHKEVADNKIQKSEAGYYLDLDDKEEDNDERFTTSNYYKVIKFKDPDYPTAEQRSYVKDFFKRMENALATSNTSSANFLAYRDMMDVDSFIRNFIVHELTKNVDGNLRLSTPLVLDNEVLSVPMVWDFDLSLGNGEIDGWFPLEDVVSGTSTGIRTYRDGDGPTGWFVKCAGGRPYGYENPNRQTAWYQRMFKDPEFVAQLKATWNEVYPNLTTVPQYIDGLYDFYSEAIQREWDIWNSSNRSNRKGANYNTPQKQYDAMRKFYTDRLEWMNTAINKL